jgi:hypothetical protein
MLGRVKKALPYIAALAFLLLFFGVGIWESSHPPQSPSQNRTAPQKYAPNYEAKKEGPEEAIARYNKYLAWFTAILALATIGLGIGNFLQIRLARAEFISTHRPKIRIKHVVLKRDIWQENPIVIDVTCVNVGTGTASLAQLGIDYFVVDKGRLIPIKTAIAAIRHFGGAELPVGLNCPIETLDINKVLTAQENADIQQERADLYCVGWVSYLDGAKRLRITGFCRILKLPPIEIARTIENCRFRRHRDPDYEYED